MVTRSRGAVTGAGLLVLLGASAAWSEDLGTIARRLAERLRRPAASTPAPRYFNATGTGVRCVALTVADVRSRGRHLFACATTDGEVLGGYLNRKGRPVCEPITGTFDAGTECWDFLICGEGFNGCFPSGPG